MHSEPQMDQTFFILGVAFAFISVAAGAFGAHALKSHLDTGMLAVFETGVRYQMYHALALIGVSWACNRWPSTLIAAGGWLLACGSLVFSGSLYLLCLTGAKWPGAITPLGGLALLAGWLCLALGALQTR
jgi:uncharacterized membrane protein YgdD (TMEM256/DUF423 family)